MNRILTCSLLAFLAFTLSACGSRSDINLGKVKVLQKGTLVACTKESLEGFDSALYEDLHTLNSPTRMLYNRLVGIDLDATDVGASVQEGLPGLAQSWSISEDGTEYTFLLRRGVKFHTTDYFTPTRDFNADDVIFSFNRLSNEDHPWYEYDPAASWEIPISIRENPIGSRIGALFTDIRRDDDYTVTFVLKTPFTKIEPLLKEGSVSILSAEYAAQLEASDSKINLNIEPIGTGPLQYFKVNLDIRIIDKGWYISETREKDFIINYSLHPNYWDRSQTLKNTIALARGRDQAVATKFVLLGTECEPSIILRPEET